MLGGKPVLSDEAQVAFLGTEEKPTGCRSEICSTWYLWYLSLLSGKQVNPEDLLVFCAPPGVLLPVQHA